MTKTIAINAKYRINADERNLILEERYMSQPPVGKPKPDDFVSVERWREANSAYYSLTPRGLAALLEVVAIKSALDRQPTDLAELAREIRAISAEINAKVSGLFIDGATGPEVFA